MTIDTTIADLKKLIEEFRSEIESSHQMRLEELNRKIQHLQSLCPHINQHFEKCGFGRSTICSDCGHLLESD